MLAVVSGRARWMFEARASPLTSHMYARHLAAPVVTIGKSKDNELKEAREWLSNFSPETIPKNIFEISFSRSSGPGGQNVNKVNSKATLRTSLNSLLKHVPIALHPAIQTSRYCANGSDSVIIQADENRKQGDNVNRCYMKLHDMILEAGTKMIPGETSEEQRNRVKGLQKSANEQRLRMKKAHTMKKTSRKGNTGRPGEW